jgi:nucleoside-diphosphate-sugar epimerase
LKDTPPLILVTGATGAVGPRVVASLFDAGYRVRTLSVDPPRENMWQDSLENQIGDVANPADVQSAMQGVDAVIHLASLLHIFNPPCSLRGMYERVNVKGTAIVVKAAAETGVRRIVYFSTIAVYGDSQGQILTEETPPQPNTFYGQTKHKAESIIIEARRQDGQPLGTVLRFGAIYGAHIKGNYRRLLEGLAKRRFIPIGNGYNRRSLVYDKDVGRAAVLAVSHPAAAGRVFNVTDGEFHTLHEIIECMSLSLGRKPPLISVPVGPVRALIGLIAKGSRAIGLTPPITQEMIDKYTEDIAVDSHLIQKDLGFIPQYDLRGGWEDTIREMMI